MKRTLAQKYEAYRHNMTSGMWDTASEEFKLDVPILKRMGTGYVPGDITDKGPRWQNAWVFAERNPNGDVVGLMLRYRDTGKKFCVTGSKHGLYFEYDPSSDKSKKRFNAGRHEWMRVDDDLYPLKDKGCPVCGRQKYCMVSADDPVDPPAVLCTKKKTRIQQSTGWLHILDASRNMGGVKSPMKTSGGPVLCVEGATDWGAGLALGFSTIGRPSNLAGLDMLREMPFHGEPIWIIGENDKTVDAEGNLDWPGKDGVEKTAANLQGLGTITKVYPPDGVKDLHDWLVRGLTRDEFERYVEENGAPGDELDPDFLVDDDVIKISKRYIKETHTVRDVPVLRLYHGDWYQWNESCYERFLQSKLRGSIYEFLEGKQFMTTDQNGGKQIRPYKASRAKVSDILDAFNGTGCLIEGDPPCWTRGMDGPKPENLICFKNGVLDVEEFIDGKVTLYEPHPDLFALTSCPYDFKEGAGSTFVDDFLLDTYGGNKDCVDLVWEWNGYLLVPDMSFEKMMLLYGDPRSGKGTILEMMSNVVGVDQCCAVTLSGIVESFGLEPLLGKMVCTLGDVRNPSQKIMAAAMVIMLNIVGGDPMPVNIKGVRGLPQVYLKTRFTLAMNELPAFVDDTRAMESRLLILKHFGSHVDDEDPRIKKRVIHEAREGKLILHALNGLKRLRENNRFTKPESSNEIMTQFRAISAPVATFLQECCAVKSDSAVGMDSIFEVWVGWCKVSMRKPGLPEQFSKWLLGHAPSVKRDTTEDAGRVVQVFTGIEINDWAYEKYI